MSFDFRAFRDALGNFATGIVVITGRTGDGTPVGVTVNSFTSVSLDPPLVLFCLARTAQSLEAFERASHFAVNVLAEDQRDLSVRFSRFDISDRWAGLVPEAWDTAPVLSGCLATLECAHHALHDGGDHVILVGRVLRIVTRPGKPLLYFRGGYAHLA